MAQTLEMMIKQTQPMDRFKSSLTLLLWLLLLLVLRRRPLTLPRRQLRRQQAMLHQSMTSTSTGPN